MNLLICSMGNFDNNELYSDVFLIDSKDSMWNVLADI